MTILLAAAQAVAIVVIAYGFIATAVCVLGRPDLRAILHRSQDGVALLGLVSLLHPVRLLPGRRFSRRFHHREPHARSPPPPPAGTLSTVQLIAWFPVLFITFLASIYTLLKIPALTNHIFSGTAGGSSAAIRRKGLRMNNDASFHDAKRLYLEQYGDPMVTNTYLKIALAPVRLLAVGLALVDLKTIRTFQNFRPLVIRIDDLGRAEAINYHNLEYKPQDAEAKYFLSQFCALYYRRNRYTIQDDFSKSLYFLDGKLANGILDAYRKDDVIKKFITNTAAPEIDVDVKKVALEEMQNAALPRARGLLHGLLLARRP